MSRTPVGHTLMVVLHTKTPDPHNPAEGPPQWSTTSRDRVQDAKASLRGAVQQKRKNASSQCSASRRGLLPQAHKKQP